MKRFSLKQKFVAAGAAATLVIGGTAAFAFFTAAGSGTGSATVGTSSAITLAATVTGAVTPDGVTGSVSVLVTNPGTGAQTVGSIHLDSITADAGHSTCVVTVPTAFSMADIAVNTNLAAGASTTKTGTLVMHDTGVNQDDCQGATLTLNLSSN